MGVDLGGKGENGGRGGREVKSKEGGVAGSGIKRGSIG